MCGSVVGPRSNFKNRSSPSQVQAYWRWVFMTIMRKPSMIMLVCLTTALATPAPAQTGNILSDKLQHHGSGKGVQTESIQTESLQTESIQTGTAGTMARTEI